MSYTYFLFFLHYIKKIVILVVVFLFKINLLRRVFSFCLVFGIISLIIGMVRCYMMNRKGQALVEFVLILPVFLLMLLAMIDFGNLLSSRNQLENTSSDVVRLILNGKEISQIEKQYNDIVIYVSDYQDEYKRISFIKKIQVITPFLDKVLGNPCEVKVERIIPLNSGERNEFHG